SSGSTTLWRPCAGLGTSSVNTQGPRRARSLTALSRGCVAAVLWATTSTLVGAAEDSITSSLLAGCRDHRTAAHPAASGPAVEPMQTDVSLAQSLFTHLNA